ncbi:MAG TPA: GNAT family protein [Pyrinomonadaceae bacterium]|nr:GNAT family protein [Pyrinomonadaceae bacterium]
MTENKLKGKKVFLRYPKPEDFEEFTTANKASRKFHHNLVNPPTDAQGFADFLRRNETETDRCFLICQIEDGAIVGGMCLSQIFRKAFQNAYLGYYLFEKFTGKGYMTEAVRLILLFAFRDLKLHRVEANVQPHNTASIAVLQRCGFTKEGFSRKYLKIGGRWRDHERWAIIKEDWRKEK